MSRRRVAGVDVVDAPDSLPRSTRGVGAHATSRHRQNGSQGTGKIRKSSYPQSQTTRRISTSTLPKKSPDDQHLDAGQGDSSEEQPGGNASDPDDNATSPPVTPVLRRSKRIRSSKYTSPRYKSQSDDEESSGTFRLRPGDPGPRAVSKSIETVAVPNHVSILGVCRTISRDNSAGDDHKRSEAMALLGSRQNQGLRPSPVVVERLEPCSPTPSSRCSTPPSGLGADNAPGLLAANESSPGLGYEHDIYEVPRVAPGNGLPIVTAGLGVGNAPGLLNADDSPWSTICNPSHTSESRTVVPGYSLPPTSGSLEQVDYYTPPFQGIHGPIFPDPPDSTGRIHPTMHFPSEHSRAHHFIPRY